MGDDALRMNRFSLRFADPGLEAAFTSDQIRKLLRPVRVAALVGIAVVVCMSVLIDQIVPQARALTFAPSFAMLVLLALLYAFTYTQAFLKGYGTGVVIIACALSAVFAWIAAFAPAVDVILPGTLIFMVIHTLNGYNLLRLRFPVAVAGGWLGAAVFLGYLGYAHVLTGGGLLRSSVALILANVFGMLAAYQLDLFARREFVATIENVRLFREIQEKSAQLEVASRHKSEFLANMSHELRTPLNAILGFSEVLVEKMFGEVNEKQLDYLKDIHSSGQHLLSLINDILDLSKIEAGKMELQVSEFDLPEALQTAISLVKERAQRHGIELKLEVVPSLGMIHADERKFKQIMLNLLSNAVKFTPEAGSITVAAKTNGKMVEVSVADSGAGIAPEDHGAVFEEFRQVGGDAARKAEGTGLGLPLAKRFVELHGGQIGLESAPGKGSTFTFTIPLRSA